MNSNIPMTVLSMGLALLLYWLPGFLVMRGIRVEGLGILGRTVAYVAASLIAVPYVAVTAGSLIRVPLTWPVLVAILLGMGVLGEVIRRVASPSLTLRSRVDGFSTRRWERLGVAALILLTVVLTQVARADALVHGAQAQAIPWDVNWHVAELTSLARSGIPPQHFFFPDARLTYYYWSLVYPAFLGNLGVLSIDLVRALAIHSIIQVATFLACVAWFILSSYRCATTRWVGLFLVTLSCGFDFFVVGEPGAAENWQRGVAWLVSHNEVGKLSNLYLSYPQHIAGLMAFLLLLALWRNVRTSVLLKSIIAGAVAAFLLGTSPAMFVAWALIMAVAVLQFGRFIIRQVRSFLRSPRNLCVEKRVASVLGGLLSFAVSFAIGSTSQVLLTAEHWVRLVWNNFRVPLLERFFGAETQGLVLVDRLLTLVGLPVVAFWVLLVEIGLAVLLFCYWAISTNWQSASSWKRVLLIYPIIGFALVFIFRDNSTPNTFSRNSAVPATLCLILGGLYALERHRVEKAHFWTKVAGRYALGVAIAAQMVSPMIELETTWKVPLGSALGVSRPLTFLKVPLAAPPSHWPDELQYIMWANANTPLDALFVEEPPFEDDVRYRRLERMRFLGLSRTLPMTYFSQDEELLSARDLALAVAVHGGGDLLSAAMGSRYVEERKPPIYYVARSGPLPSLGNPVYVDNSVWVYYVGLEPQ